MKPLALSPAEQHRLEKLARNAGRSPRSMMRFVLRDGFEYSEWQVRESNAAETEARRLGTIPNAEVRRVAKAAIEAARGRRRRNAA